MRIELFKNILISCILFPVVATLLACGGRNGIGSQRGSVRLMGKVSTSEPYIELLVRRHLFPLTDRQTDRQHKGFSLWPQAL